MKNKEFNKEFKKFIEENYSEIIDDGIDDKPHVEALFNEFLKKIPSDNVKHRFTIKKVIKRISIIAACVIIVFIGSIYLAYVPQAQAFRFNIENAFQRIMNDGQDKIDEDTVTKYYSSFDEIDKNIANQLPYFNWVPEGFQLDNIQITTINESILVAAVNYKDGSSGYIDISLNPYADNNGAGYINDSKFQILKIDNIEVGVSIDRPYFAEFFYRGSYLVSINTSVDKNTLIKIIEQMS